MYDFIIIGAGIIGSTIARELSKYDVKALVLERENDVANVQTLANSAIIHSGHNPEPNTLKAKFNVLGNKLYDELEKELNIPILHCGAYVVAHNKKEEEHLLELYENAKINNVPEFEILDYEEAVKSEPNLSKNTTKVLSLPTTKVTNPWEVAFACMENAMDNGIEFQKNTEVTNIEYRDDHFIITINNQDKLESLAVINAAGVNSDDLAHMIEKKKPFYIKPRKGEYFVIDRRVKGFINHILYPLPTDAGKGVLLTPQVHGEILVGPNSKYIDNKYSKDVTFEGLDYVRTNAPALADNIPFDKIIRSFAGVRASSNLEDFYIEESKEFKRLYHLGGIDSPGLSAAPAIAKYLLEDIIKIKDLYNINKNFNPYREKRIEFHRLSYEEQLELIEKYPTYGNIICKCEKITEKEIVDAIHSRLGSDTIKGIKKRTRAGSGLCQGGYCEEKVMKIIARETSRSPIDTLYDSPKSNLFKAETKVKQ